MSKLISFSPPQSLAYFWNATEFYQFIVGPLGCMAPETLVRTKQGLQRIDSIAPGTQVLSWCATRNRFVFSSSDNAHRKGTDYLYQIAMPQGVFVAAGHHRVQTALRGYQPVSSLLPGDVLSCCVPRWQSALESAWLWLPSSARHYLGISAGCLCRYAELTRRYGLLLLLGLESARCAAPLPNGAPTQIHRSSLFGNMRLGTQDLPIFLRTRYVISACQRRMQGYFYRFCQLYVPPLPGEVNPLQGRYVLPCGVSSPARPLLLYRFFRRYMQCAVALYRILFSSLFNTSYSYSSTERSIISIIQLGVKQDYWDISVEDTHNYVTEDWCIHHNSTKTTNVIFKMLMYSQAQHKGPDGKRRSRWVIARPTLQQIKTTVLKDIEQWLGPICHIRVADSVIQIRTDEVIADWHMIPLENIEDQRRLLSMQLTGVYFNEFREIPFELVAAAAGRVGRYPSPAHGGCAWYGVLGDSNPPNIDSPYYDFLIGSPADNVHYTGQPGGLDHAADWRQWLPPQYYENLMQGHADDWVDIHVHAKWGMSRAGQPVYKNSFSEAFHVAKGPLTPIPGYPLVIGMDFARWPAAIIGQIDYLGRLLLFKELESENTGVEKFIKTKLIPELSSTRFYGLPFYVVGDPSGTHKGEIGEEHVFDMLKRLGVPAYPAQTNNIQPRLRAVEKYLLQQRDGKAALLVDSSGCPMLIQGFIYKYRFKTDKAGVLQETPDKTNRPYPDLHDALQYLALGTSHSISSRALRKRSAPKAPIPVGSWT